nr:MAG TPA: hypothetical protein [Caudoviricetes sp.]
MLTHCCNYIIKHLEKSKCFFHAQKGGFDEQVQKIDRLD